MVFKILYFETFNARSMSETQKERETMKVYLVVQ
jgi:hypothetical protein